jgi:hypothetical protein
MAFPAWESYDALLPLGAPLYSGEVVHLTPPPRLPRAATKGGSRAATARARAATARARAGRPPNPNPRRLGPRPIVP